MRIAKFVLTALVAIMFITLPLASATQYNVNIGRQININADYPADSSYSFIFIGAYWSATKGNNQWAPTFYDVDNSGISLPNSWIQGGIRRDSYVIETEIKGGADLDTTVYDDEKAVFLMIRDNPPVYTPLAWWYWETPWIGTDYSHWLVYGQDVPTVINPNSWDTVTYNFNVVDSKGNPIPYYHYDLIVDFVADDSGNYGVRSTNKGLFTHVLDEYLSGSLTGIDGVIYNTTMIRIKGITFEEKALTLPKWVYYGDQYDTDDQPYKLRFRAVYNVNGTDYYSDWVTVDTTNGNSDITLTIPYDTQGGISQDYVYIIFYEDESKQTGVYLPNYNISVIKANTPDGLSFPATHTYELHNYYTLKIPVDSSYPYVTVTLKDGLGNVVFKKGYVMQSGVYEEYFTGAKKLVMIKVYDTSTGAYLDNFMVTMKGSTTDYTVNAVNGTVSVAVVPDTYIVEVNYNGNIIYSTVLEAYNSVYITFFVKANYTGVIKFKFVDSSLKSVNVQSIIDSYDIRLENSIFNFELPNLNTVYSQDPSYMNNVMYYYIRNNEELTAWQNEGFYLKLLDKQTGIETRKYYLKMDSNPDEFMIILPIVTMPGETEPYVLPPEVEEITDEQRDQMTRQTTTAVFDYLFAKGLLVIIITVAIAVELGGGLGLFVGLSLLLAFTWMGMVPKTFGALASLGFGAGLIMLFKGGGGEK